MAAVIGRWLEISTLLIYLLFVHYIAVMKLREMHRAGTLARLHWTVRLFAWLYLGIGLALDALTNFVVLTVLFLEFPPLTGGRDLIEWLCTDRVKRHKNHGQGWRKAQAEWWCQNWLTPFDESHCEG